MTPQAFLEHFETFAAAPNGIAKLRALILQLAVQGKIVPQEEGDESTQTLIESIVQQKAELVRKKKVRNSNAHTSRDAGEDNYELPQGWSWVTLDTITEIGTGGTPPTGTKEYYHEGTIPWITSSATNSEFISNPEQFITQRAVADCGLKIYPAGSLVVALYGQGKTRGQVGQLMFDSTSNQACAVIRFFGDGLGIRDYVRLFFRKMYHELRDLAAGGAQPNLNGGMIRLMRVPLPPLAEQRRIVEKVDQLLGLCDELAARQAAQREKRQRLVGATLDRLVSPQTSRHLACRAGLTASAPLDSTTTGAKANEPPGQARWRVMQDDAHRLRNHFDQLFDTPTTIPQLRQTIVLLAVQGQLVPQDPSDEPASETLQAFSKQLIESMKNMGRTWIDEGAKAVEERFDSPPGWTWTQIANVVERVTVGYVGSMKNEYVKDGVPFLRSQNVRPNRYSEIGLVYISPDFHKSIEKSALTAGDVVVVRSGAGVGVACAIPSTVTDANCSDLVVIKSPTAVLPEYLSIYLNSIGALHVVTGTVGAALPHFNTKSVATMPLALPPLAEQKRIVTKVTELLSLCDALEAKLTQAESASTQLLSAAVHQLLNGAVANV